MRGDAPKRLCQGRFPFCYDIVPHSSKRGQVIDIVICKDTLWRVTTDDDPIKFSLEFLFSDNLPKDTFQDIGAALSLS